MGKGKKTKTRKKTFIQKYQTILVVSLLIIAVAVVGFLGVFSVSLSGFGTTPGEDGGTQIITLENRLNLQIYNGSGWNVTTHVNVTNVTITGLGGVAITRINNTNMSAWQFEAMLNGSGLINDTMFMLLVFNMNHNASENMSLQYTSVIRNVVVFPQLSLEVGFDNGTIQEREMSLFGGLNPFTLNPFLSVSNLTEVHDSLYMYANKSLTYTIIDVDFDGDDAIIGVVNWSISDM